MKSCWVLLVGLLCIRLGVEIPKSSAMRVHVRRRKISRLTMGNGGLGPITTRGSVFFGERMIASDGMHTYPHLIRFRKTLSTRLPNIITPILLNKGCLWWKSGRGLQHTCDRQSPWRAEKFGTIRMVF